MELVTPTRLIERDRLVKQDGLSFGALLGRLLERLSALFGRYGDATGEGAGAGDGVGLMVGGPVDAVPDKGGSRPFEVSSLLRLAAEVRIVERHLVWRELFRASGRHGRMVPMGGLVGEVILEGDLAPFLPWLVWGSLVHVGKDAAMGNGQFGVEALP
jgi:hypothetical protein